MKKNTFKIFLIVLIIITIPFPAYADYGTIEIDGYYDDWEDKPHTEVYPGKNPPESKINHVSLFRDEESVSVHVIFAQKNNQDITNMTINLDTNLGDENYFLVPDVWFNETNEENLFAESDQQTILLVGDEEGNIDNNTNTDTNTDTGADTDPLETNADPTETNTDPLETNTDQVTETDAGDQTSDPENIVDPEAALDQFVPDGTSDSGIETDELNPNLNIKKPEWYGTWAFSVYDGLSPVGSGYYTRTEGAADELELYIPLSSITHQYDGITEISMKIKKLGPQVIICAGASSEPFIGVVIGAGIAVLSVGAYSYKKKRKDRSN